MQSGASSGDRPSFHQRKSSTEVSLSSSGKPGATKQPRPHVVSRHSRNASSKGGSGNMGKKSMSAVYGDGTKHHKRSKSGTSTPVASPKLTGGGAGHMKRNSSHVVLPKNRSHGNLRKNQSTNTLTALNRNLSRNALNKLGAPADQKAKKDAQQKQGVFDLGNNSDDEEEEAEWEDSTASPEVTRNNSKVPTPIRAHTPNGEPILKPVDTTDEAHLVPPEKTSSPPEPTIMKTNRSAPDLRNHRNFNPDRPRQDPALLQPNGRGSRAPPAMVTANVHSSQQNLLPRNDSQRSLLRSSLETSQESAKTPGSQGIGVSSSGSAGVSHFLPNDTSLPQTPRDRIDSDDDESVSDFMAVYKPQPSESPDRPRTNINRARIPSQPSRTQQKLELQRKELMRGTGPPQMPPSGMAHSVGSSVSLHSRTHSHSKGRPKSVVGELKAIKQEYDTAVKQLTVVRRFRNPVLESLNRLKQSGAIPNESSTPAPGTTKPLSDSNGKRPPSRHGRASQHPETAARDANTNGSARTSVATTATHILSEDHHDSPAGAGQRASKISFASGTAQAPRPGGGRDSRVTFQLSRQESHDDILTTGTGANNGAHDDYVGDGLSPEEALIRRVWESRVHAV